MNVQALCVGHASFDMTMLVEAYPAENSKAQTDILIEAGGGPAANAAWLLASWGVPTAFAGAVGDDTYGRRVAEELFAAGVDVSLLDKRPGQATAVSFILVNLATASRTIVNRQRSGPAVILDGSAIAALAPEFLLFDGHEPAASLTAMEALPNATTMLDAGSLREGTSLLARRVDYLVCSERFALQTTGLEDLSGSDARRECLRRLAKINDKTIVVTLGEQGLIYRDGRQSGHLSAREVQPVDTTAAGDVFHGAMVFALLKQMSLVEALHVATTAAGLSVQSAGGRASIPTWIDVQKAMLPI